MKCNGLLLVRIRMQTVVSIVLCHFVQLLPNSVFDIIESEVLGNDTQNVCVDEVPCSIMDKLIVCVDVEYDSGENTSLVHAILLQSPSASVVF